MTGLKVKFVPTNARGGVSQSVDGAAGNINSSLFQSYLESQLVYLDVDTLDTSNYTAQQITALDKNWVYDPTRTWKKWFPCKNLSRMQNLKW